MFSIHSRNARFEAGKLFLRVPGGGKSTVVMVLLVLLVWPRCFVSLGLLFAVSIVKGERDRGHPGCSNQTQVTI